ncbi:hypothetical protein INR49_002533 [Caranx melampygus]|nr:hypothetical protein INR49_002533 [Caranx melampygus]
MKDYDNTVAFLGQWGRFQQVVFFLLCLSIMPNGFGAFSLVFLMGVQSHRCLVPDVNLTEDWREASIPIMGLAPGRDVNVTDLQQEDCVDGWTYSKDIHHSTIVSEFNLVCTEQWKQPFTNMIFYLGVVIGSFLSGPLSDRFGRKPVLFATTAVQTIFTFAQVFSVSWTMFTILLFFNGLGQMSNFVAGLVLGAETLTGNVRILYSSLGTMIGFAVGYMMLPLCAYFLRNWKSLLVAMSIPGMTYLPLWWLIPESPRWLLSKGRMEEADAILRKAAKWNKVQAPRVIFADCSMNETKTNLRKHHKLLDMLRKHSIRVTTLILCLLTFTATIDYYGLSFNTAQLHADVFISSFISAAVEVPAYISSWLALRYVPRRLSVIVTMLGGAVPLYIIILVPKNLSNLSLALEMFGKFSITTCFSMMFTYTAELYPTGLRNTATGTVSTVGRLGSCLTPFLLRLSVYYKYLPYIIMGTLAVVSAAATLFLPESFGRPLPETIQQMHKRERIKCPCISGADTSAYGEHPDGVSDYDKLILNTCASLSDLSVTMEMLGKFGVTTGMSLIFAYTAELYPTVLRNTATGVYYLPYITLGTLTVVSPSPSNY